MACTKAKLDDRMSNARVAILDDDPAMLKLTEATLASGGYQVQVWSSSAAAVEALTRDPPDLLVVDWMMPELSGDQVCRILRSKEPTANLPIIMLTTRDQAEDCAEGLEAGADDYLRKPAHPRELLSRVAALLRRSRQQLQSVKQLGALRIHRGDKQVSVGERVVELTAAEFNLLDCLAAQPGRVYTRGQLLRAIGSADVVASERTIDVHVRSLRKKLGPECECIETVRGFGYRFKA